MLESYFDDSADPKRERFTSCGGFIAREDQWDRFELLWMSATHELTAPFRSTECECQHGQFKNWPKSKCNDLMAELVSLVLNQDLAGFAAIVPITDYKSAYPLSGEYDPFYLAVKHTLANMAHIASLIGEQMKCWFEESETTQGKINQIYIDMKARREWKNRRWLARIGFVPKRLLKMNTGDLLAREAFKHIDNLGIRNTRKPVKRLAGRISFHVWTKDSLHELAKIPDDLTYFTSTEAVTNLEADLDSAS